MMSGIKRLETSQDLSRKVNSEQQYIIFPAGDYVKFGFPMAWATTVLAWGMLEFQEAYEDANEWENALDSIRWTADYFVKAHVSPNEFYFQVSPLLSKITDSSFQIPDARR